ncbi:MAG: cytochrome c oxidase subunit 3 [Acidocella sp.]|uniref:cytochrome c oxidase subunit 3 n=1 Tax=Acidocella sp. TaxID=50710 RepID=UPI003FBDD95C
MASFTKAGADTVLWNAGADAHDNISARTYGFWLYLLSDALIIAAVFATYAVLNNPMNAAGGPLGSQFLSASKGLLQTFIVLGSVLCYSLATVALKRGSKLGVSLGMIGAILLAVVFLGIGLGDLTALSAAGNGFARSGYLSCFFTLIVTHALHMGFGILWMLVMLVQVGVFGFTENVVARLLNLRMFWQFQASVWVVVYIYVYLFGGAH